MMEIELTQSITHSQYFLFVYGHHETLASSSGFPLTVNVFGVYYKVSLTNQINFFLLLLLSVIQYVSRCVLTQPDVCF